MILVWWFVVVLHTGADVLVDRDVSKGVALFLSSIEPYVAIGSVVSLDAFRESGVYCVDPCGQFGFWVVMVIVACDVSVVVHRLYRLKNDNMSLPDYYQFM